MRIDMVHDMQRLNRIVVDAMAKPGTIGQLADIAGKLADIADKLGRDRPCSGSAVALALLLLDAEVGFHVCSARQAEMTEWLRRFTYAKASTAAEADYIWIAADAGGRDREETLRLAKRGTLENPHLSATIIMEAHSLYEGKELELSGPGIAGTRAIRVDLEGDWARIREERNREYPLGIDLMLLDVQREQLVGLPRTTQMLRRVMN